jgi:hypothetical protein
MHDIIWATSNDHNGGVGASAPRALSMNDDGLCFLYDDHCRHNNIPRRASDQKIN